MDANYQPLADVRKDLRVEWYRCPIDHAKLRALSSHQLQGSVSRVDACLLFSK